MINVQPHTEVDMVACAYNPSAGEEKGQMLVRQPTQQVSG